MLKPKQATFFFLRKLKNGLQKFVPRFSSRGKDLSFYTLPVKIGLLFRKVAKTSNCGFFIFGISAITHDRVDEVNKLFHRCNPGSKTFHLIPIFNFAKNHNIYEFI